MLSRRGRAVVVAILGVVALSVVATTVAPPTPTEGGGGSGEPTTTTDPGALPAADGFDGQLTVVALVAFSLALLVIVAVVARNAGSVVGTVLGGVVVLALLAGVAVLLGGDGTPAGQGSDLGRGPPGAGTDDARGDGLDPIALLPPAVLVAGTLVAGGVLVLRERLDDVDDDGDGGTKSGPDPDAVGAVAARAAERIRSAAAADNEVYRCWVEVTRLVDPPDPETYTPAEFATAAVEAGMDPGDVEELRRLFEEVRYGGTDPQTHEDRALSVFERIAAEYGDGDRPTEAESDG